MRPLMSSDSAYFDAVQDYFLERTGRGLILSSRDLELLLGWFQSGASAAVVCQGIDEAVEVLGQAPRDLHACKKFVQERVDRLGEVRVGISRAPRALEPAAVSPTFDAPSRVAPARDVPAEDVPGVLERLRTVHENAGRPELRAVYGHLFAQASEMIASGRDPVAVSYSVEDQMVDDVYAALPADDRQSIDLQIEQRFGPHLQVMAAEARDETVRACRRDILTARYGLPKLVEE